MKRLLRHPSGLVGLILVVIVVFTAVAAPYISPHPPRQQRIARRMLPPAWMERGNPQHPLGTDQLGRDTLSRVIYGSRVSILVAVAAVALAGTVGTALGLWAGYRGGKVDYVISMIINMAWSFPYILLALIIVAVLGASLTNLIIALSATSWANFARVIRNEAVRLRAVEYVEAARAVGCSTLRIVTRHVLPNVTATLVVIGTIEFARAILREAFLSFLGLGIPPQIPSWGGMLSEARPYMHSMWWLATFPGVAIFLTALGANLLGDGLRDAYDPRLRR